MKKILTLTCTILLVVLLCSVCVACNRTDRDDDGNNSNGGNNQYEVAKYTVTFNTLSNYTFENNVLTGVVAGSKIKAPTNDKGEKIIPTKTGYTFQYWTEDGKKEFDFNTQTINKNTTLSAYYSPNEFNHNYVLGATYTYNEDGTITVNEGEYKNSTGYDMTIGADAKVKSVYNDKTNLDCPEAENDTFCFWFYLDKDNKPVRFTALASDTDTNVASLDKYTLTYNTSDVLTLYPMFRSTLPVVTLQYLAKDGSVLKESPMRSIDKIAESDKFTPENISGYKFSKWYYETINSDKETVKNDIKYESDAQTGTTVFAMGGFDGYFEGGTVKIYSKWIKQIAISSTDQYKSVYNTLHKENPTEEEKVAIEEILDADIQFSGEINFGTSTLKPLFDASHVFVGTITGGENGATISGGTYADTTHASVFGYVGGTIQNLTFKAIILMITQDGDSYQDDVRMGVVATVNSGKISNVKVYGAHFHVPESKKVTIGGIAAVNQGVASDIDKGYIEGCVAGSNTDGKISVLGGTTDKTSLLILGGVAGENKASSTIVNDTVAISVDVASGAYKIGGIAGTNGGQISKCSVSLGLENAIAEDTAYVGGAVADNVAAVDCVYVKIESAQPLIIGGTLAQSVNVGGIIGKNEGYVRNSYVDANLSVILNKSSAIAAIGGIVGNNFSGKSQSSTSTTSVGAINYCYSTGTIDVSIERETKNVKLYVAGIAGRNSQKAISSCFTLVNITVDNTVEDEAGERKNNDANTLFLGFGFGSMENNSTVTKCWYDPQNVLSLNGERYAVTVVDGEDVENFAITKTGNLKATDPDSTSSFRSETWFADNTGFDFKDVWTIEEGNLPTLRFLNK